MWERTRVLEVWERTRVLEVWERTPVLEVWERTPVLDSMRRFRDSVSDPRLCPEASKFWSAALSRAP